jgi:fungal type III polyketide synthase
MVLLLLIHIPTGFRVEITKEVAIKSVASILPTFKKLLSSFASKFGDNLTKSLGVEDFDWAVHPGGIAILKGAQRELQLSHEQLRASYEIYKHRGNTASVTVLSVLDKLRTMGEGRDNVVACSFGPGMIIEMATLKRCRF